MKEFPAEAKRIPIIILIIGIMVFSYVLIRAILVPITYDEAFSFLNFVLVDWQLFHPENYMAGNNHPINTVLMSLMNNWFGPSEISLRFPNVMAFILYAWFAWKFSNKMSFPHLKYALFILLLSSPFLLDFFSLARGYGLMLAFLMGALWQVFKNEIGIKEIGLFALFSLLAVYSNLIALHFVLAGMGVFLLKLLLVQKGRPLIKNVVILLTANCLLFFLVLPWASALNEIKTLFFGGKDGFWKDTVGSLLKVMMYRQPYAGFVSEVGTYVVSICVGIVALYFFKKFKEERWKVFKSAFSLSFILLVSAALVGIVQHALLGINFLMERTALPFIPLFFIFICFFIEELDKKWIQFSTMMMVLIVPVLHFFVSINFTHTEQWKEDCNTRDFFQRVEKLSGRNTKSYSHTFLTGGDFIFQTCFNYYKFRSGNHDIEVFAHQLPAPFLHFYLSTRSGNYPDPGKDWMKIMEDTVTGNALWKRKEIRPVLLLDTFVNYGKDVPQPLPVHRRSADCFSPPICGYTNGTNAEFCSWLEFKLPDSLDGKDILLTTEGMIKWNGNRCAGGFVVDLADSTGANTDWMIFPFLYYHPEVKGWQKFQLSRTIDSKTLSRNQINVYAWNRKGAELFLDDLRVRLFLVERPQ